MAIEKQIGARIKARRKTLKMTQEALASLADIDRGYLSEIENGRVNFSIQSLHKIATALGLTLAALIEGHNESG